MHRKLTADYYKGRSLGFLAVYAPLLTSKAACRELALKASSLDFGGATDEFVALSKRL